MKYKLKQSSASKWHSFNHSSNPSILNKKRKSKKRILTSLWMISSHQQSQMSPSPKPQPRPNPKKKIGSTSKASTLEKSWPRVAMAMRWHWTNTSQGSKNNAGDFWRPRLVIWRFRIKSIPDWCSTSKMIQVKEDAKLWPMGVRTKNLNNAGKSSIWKMAMSHRRSGSKILILASTRMSRAKKRTPERPCNVGTRPNKPINISSSFTLRKSNPSVISIAKKSASENPSKNKILSSISCSTDSTSNKPNPVKPTCKIILLKIVNWSHHCITASLACTSKIYAHMPCTNVVRIWNRRRNFWSTKNKKSKRRKGRFSPNPSRCCTRVNFWVVSTRIHCQMWNCHQKRWLIRLTLWSVICGPWPVIRRWFYIRASKKLCSTQIRAITRNLPLKSLNQRLNLNQMPRTTE